MPKNKKSSSGSSSESDSDSGPEDRAPPKKVKQSEDDKSEGGKSKKPTTKWTLESKRFVNINEFRGKKMVDIREFYEKDGDLLPGKKGISLSITQWKKLLEIAEEITAQLD